MYQNYMKRYFYVMVASSLRVHPFATKNRVVTSSSLFSTTNTASSNPFVESGHIYYVATPIGNLGDISYRAIEILKAVDVICAEDTRHTLNLLRHFEIPTKQLISHHEHNWAEQVPYIITLAKGGKSLAVVSDAGTPGIADPGRELAAACAQQGIILHPIPGPSAVIAALSISGFPGSHFTFRGFFPVKGKERSAQMAETATCPTTVVFFEAPHRVLQTMRELDDVHQIGGRGIVACRELTKLHEEIYRGSVHSCRLWLESTQEASGETHKGAADSRGASIRGEFCIVLGPLVVTNVGPDDKDLVSNLERLRGDGISRSEAVRLVSEMCNVPKAKVYKTALEMSWG